MSRGCVGLAWVVLWVVAGCAATGGRDGSDPLPSWNEGKTKQSILDFVRGVTDDQSPDFVPVAERIATFDNDGTLWVEQPLYVQLDFALARVHELATQHPEWKQQQPFKDVLDGNLKGVMAGGDHALIELIMATHTGNTTAEFEQIVTSWMASVRNKRWDRPYTQTVYQPMLELLAYLRAQGFKTFIASGGGVEFMRPWAESTYGVPPEQVIGSSAKTEYQWRDGKPALVRLPEINFINDKGGKPVGINEHIGRRPIAAFGNSDGDLEMLQWATAGSGLRLGLIVHHTDAVREYAYDTDSKIGHLSEQTLEQAKARGWTVVDMARDWKRIFPFDESPAGH